MKTKKKKENYFALPEAQFDFVQNEKKILKFWEKNGLLEKYLAKNKNSKKRFSFIDGPITANNPMGAHHAWGRTLKDLYQKYKNAQGYQQRFQNGFDCQGLWVEVEVEKALGFNSKKDIEKYGLAKFTQSCQDRVKTYAALQAEQSKRLGYFMDWDNSYYTYSETNNLYIWKFLQICRQKELLYKAKSATTWCPRCETVLSRHEQAEGYKDIQDFSVHVKFPLKNKKNEYFLAWTTTPWTLSANVLLAINPEYEYVKVRVVAKNRVIASPAAAGHGDPVEITDSTRDCFATLAMTKKRRSLDYARDDSGVEYWYLAKESADRLGLKNQISVAAKDLLGQEYESLYDIPAQKNIKHSVVKWKLANPDEGTGIVHIAPGCGEDDFLLGKSLGAPALSPLTEAGQFGPGYGSLTNKYAHEVGKEVINYLKDKNLLYKTETITHSYPHCWRCGAKTLFRLEENWFINCTKIKPELKKAAATANWIPKFAGKRMQGWLNNMGDWMISRKRFYGLSLPFYECLKCKKQTLIGSKKELKKLAVNQNLVDKLPSLHRPWVDEIKIKCPQCGKPVNRILDVGDCWLDAGVVPFSTLKYFEDKKYWQKWFPADLVLEMIEQIRLWFYSMLVYGVIFENMAPYKSVLNHGEVRDEKGERMSKTKKNGIPYDEAVEKMGVDTMRWLYCRQRPHLGLNFGYSIADEIRRRFIFLYWNSFRFLATYANLNGWCPCHRESHDVTSGAWRSRWKDCHVAPILAMTRKLDFHASSATPRNDTSPLDAWILSRLENTKKEAQGELNRFRHQNALKSLENFIEDLSLWYVRRSRERLSPNSQNTRDREACFSTLYHCLEQLSLLLGIFIPFLPETVWQNLQGNKNKLKVKDSIHLQSWPKIEKKYLNLDLEKAMAQLRNEVTEGHALRKAKNIAVKQPLSALYSPNASFFKKLNIDYLLLDELNIKKIKLAKSIKLNTKLTPELKKEGKARDLIREVQTLRRKENLELTDKIIIFAPSWPKEFEKEILLKTGGQKIQKAESLKIKKI